MQTQPCPLSLCTIVAVQTLSCVQPFENPWTAPCQAPLSFTISLIFTQIHVIESVTLSNHLILCCLFFLLPSIFPSIKVFSNESALCIRWPKYCRFRFSISPSSEYSGLISFRIDWSPCCPRDSPKSLQHHTLKASIWAQFFFLLSSSHILTWLLEKTIALTIQTFVDKVMSLSF